MCHRNNGGKIVLKKVSSPFSPRRNSQSDDDQVSVAHASFEEQAKSRKLVGDSLWLSKKMVDTGCTLEQTLHVMEERCKGCSVVTPMMCVEQCETWRVKRELRETSKVLSEDDHRLELLNAIKNEDWQSLTFFGNTPLLLRVYSRNLKATNSITVRRLFVNT